MTGLGGRIDALDWPAIRAGLDETGVATTGPLLTAAERAALTALYAGADGFRSSVDMARHGFGRGEYRYFARPLPDIVETLRQAVYARLAPVAGAWATRLRTGRAYPPTLDGFLADCHAAGQERPTPLLLKYGPGDYNRLHRDLYGAVHFPFQMVVLLSEPGLDFDGGELALVETRPRMQSRVDVVALRAGEAAIFAVDGRPETGARGDVRVALRHGVSTVRRGERFTLGVIFHDAA